MSSKAVLSIITLAAPNANNNSTSSGLTASRVRKDASTNRADALIASLASDTSTSNVSSMAVPLTLWMVALSVSSHSSSSRTTASFLIVQS